jgi:colanic acid/amylovoran biosynthesis glycosyltransferase
MFDPRLPSNVMVKFWGNVPNRTILDFYKHNCVDAFLNTSSSEGIPVSIMEALAHGIPVIAPSVGGIPEIVHSQNGILLDQHPLPHQIANALENFMPDTDEVLQKRRAAQAMWREVYDADTNFERFGNELWEMMKPS